MRKNRYGLYSFAIFALLVSSISTPVFAEVTTLTTNQNSFLKGDRITFSGNVEMGDTGLITIVIRDNNEKFVMLSQAIINSDNTFEKIVDIDNKFSNHGFHNATGFILNMSKGVTSSFGVSQTGVHLISQEVIEEEPIPEPVVEKGLADFVDLNKEPVYYVERYYTEPAYKSWFDRNYPGMTIEEAVGYEGEIVQFTSKVKDIIDTEIIPEAEAISVSTTEEENDNPEIAQIVLAIAGLGILFGAVYGIKQKVDDNSKQISINRDTIRKKIIHPIIGDSPKDILQTRLAKGEISVEEFERLSEKLR
ncbi:SHOCT domain-containing protein [Nitrosopumilus sp.]|uniref:SHOCT domain-containing protein n=1 Tax=Nitrosopumilus sp. TaxID=2024843 RepID=UPI00260B603D|nr:SHOCT domain-containing protein [Nitrosopumilus sp.]